VSVHCMRQTRRAVGRTPQRQRIAGHQADVAPVPSVPIVGPDYQQYDKGLDGQYCLVTERQPSLSTSVFEHKNQPRRRYDDDAHVSNLGPNELGWQVRVCQAECVRQRPLGYGQHKHHERYCSNDRAAFPCIESEPRRDHRRCKQGKHERRILQVHH